MAAGSDSYDSSKMMNSSCPVSYTGVDEVHIPCTGSPMSSGCSSNACTPSNTYEQTTTMEGRRKMVARKREMKKRSVWSCAFVMVAVSILNGAAAQDAVVDATAAVSDATTTSNSDTPVDCPCWDINACTGIAFRYSPGRFLSLRCITPNAVEGVPTILEGDLTTSLRSSDTPQFVCKEYRDHIHQGHGNRNPVSSPVAQACYTEAMDHFWSMLDDIQDDSFDEFGNVLSSGMCAFPGCGVDSFDPSSDTHNPLDYPLSGRLTVVSTEIKSVSSFDGQGCFSASRDASSIWDNCFENAVNKMEKAATGFGDIWDELHRL